MGLTSFIHSFIVHKKNIKNIKRKKTYTKTHFILEQILYDQAYYVSESLAVILDFQILQGGVT